MPSGGKDDAVGKGLRRLALRSLAVKENHRKAIPERNGRALRICMRLDEVQRRPGVGGEPCCGVDAWLLADLPDVCIDADDALRLRIQRLAIPEGVCVERAEDESERGDLERRVAQPSSAAGDKGHAEPGHLDDRDKPGEPVCLVQRLDLVDRDVG